LEEITALVNNNPKLDERYKMLLRHDIPEGSGPNVPIQTQRVLRLMEGKME
jgi:hypothetical protein